MKPTFTFVLIFVFCAFISSAQGIFSVSGNARGSAVGGAGLGFSGAYALPYNQAGIAESESIGASAAAERRFLLESINGLSAGRKPVDGSEQEPALGGGARADTFRFCNTGLVVGQSICTRKAKPCTSHRASPRISGNGKNTLGGTNKSAKHKNQYESKSRFHVF